MSKKCEGRDGAVARAIASHQCGPARRVQFRPGDRFSKASGTFRARKAIKTEKCIRLKLLI